MQNFRKWRTPEYRTVSWRIRHVPYQSSMKPGLNSNPARLTTRFQSEPAVACVECKKATNVCCLWRTESPLSARLAVTGSQNHYFFSTAVGLGCFRLSPNAEVRSFAGVRTPSKPMSIWVAEMTLWESDVAWLGSRAIGSRIGTDLRERVVSHSEPLDEDLLNVASEFVLRCVDVVDCCCCPLFDDSLRRRPDWLWLTLKPPAICRKTLLK